MKPQFSILALLVITAYAAINVAAFRSLGFSAAARWLWWGIVFLALIESTGRTAARTVFARGLCLSVLFAFAAISYNHAHLYPLLLLLEQTTDAISGTQADEDVHHFAIELAAHLFGLIGGALAVWRFRRLERYGNRESEPNRSENGMLSNAE
jgi:membrane associated rhomboid family serine protease